MEKSYQNIPSELAPLLHAISHPARIQIVMHLAKFNGCQAGSISEKLPLAKSTVSEHLSKLKEVGLIRSLADGNCIHYALADKTIDSVKRLFNDFIQVVDQSKEYRIKCSTI